MLLVAGLLALGVWAGAALHTAVYQSWGNWAFDRAVQGESATVSEYLTAKKDAALATINGWLGKKTAEAPPRQTDSRPSEHPAPAPPPIRQGAVVGRLIVPRLAVRAVVREGAGEDALDLALGHIPGTALPGQPGNVGVAGHRDTLFRPLRYIRPKDLIRFQTLTGNYLYEVEGTQIVNPRNVGVLKAGKRPEMTLVTCYPFGYVGSAPDRFIVKAKLISQRPARTDTP